MINNLLHNLVPSDSVRTVFKNETFEFEIKALHLKDFSAKLIYTEGLAKLDQRTFHADAELPFVELYFLLPEYWDENKDSWPITWLNRIAELPRKNNTWFSVGDTIPAGNPIKEISAQLHATYFILTEPILLESVFKYKDESSHNVQPLAIVPIFKQEWNYKKRKGSYQFFTKLKNTGQSEMIDNFRSPVTRKGLLRL